MNSHPYFLISYFILIAVAAAKLLQSCPTLCNPIEVSPPGSPVPGILQARTLEWVAISFSNAGKWKVKGKSLSCVWLFATPWTAAHQAPLSMGFSRQECWSGLPLPSPSFLLILYKNTPFQKGIYMAPDISVCLQLRFLILCLRHQFLSMSVLAIFGICYTLCLT